VDDLQLAVKRSRHGTRPVLYGGRLIRFTMQPVITQIADDAYTVILAYDTLSDRMISQAQLTVRKGGE